MHLRELLSDERDRLSSARVSWWTLLLALIVLIGADTFGPWDVPGPAYVLLGTLVTGVLAWTAGPRVAQYIGPQMAGVAAGIAAASKRLAGTDDARKDDERG